MLTAYPFGAESKIAALGRREEVSSDEHPISRLEGTFKKSSSTLKKAGIPFMLGGGLACWARGGPETYNDLDLFVKPEKRGKGYGRALLVDLAKIARDRGCGRIFPLDGRKRQR